MTEEHSNVARRALNEIERLEQEVAALREHTEREAHEHEEQIADAVRAAITDERAAVVQYLRDPARQRDPLFSPHTWAKGILAGAHLRASVNTEPCAALSDACTRRGSERIEVMQ